MNVPLKKTKTKKHPKKINRIRLFQFFWEVKFILVSLSVAILSGRPNINSAAFRVDSIRVTHYF